MKWLLLLSCCLVASTQARLSTSGKDLIYNGQKVFLSGVNIAWNSYGYDFGNGQWAANSKSTLLGWLDSISGSGGNSVRIWLHIEGANTPNYDGQGFVTGPDRTGTMINDMKEYLDYAQSKNILVIFVLWNGAYLREQNTINLFWDDAKLQSYIDKALIPMVSALGNHPALGAWEIINEPEGSVYAGQSNSNRCFDTQILAGSGAGWVGHFIPMQNILKFVNWQSAAIKETNSGAMVTVGSWCEFTQTDSFSNTRNYYTDECLIAAGGRTKGTLDIYQMHTYANNGQWNQNGPMKVSASAYGLNKPLIIGEFASVCAQGETIQQLFGHGYNSGFQGVWSWQYNAGGECADTASTQNNGMGSLKGQNGAGGVVNFPVQ